VARRRKHRKQHTDIFGLTRTQEKQIYAGGKALTGGAKALAQAYRHRQERKLLSLQHQHDVLEMQRADISKRRELKKQIRETQKTVSQQKTFKKLGIEQY